MASCELCGAQSYTVLAHIEGSKMYVCKSCSSFGLSVKPKPVRAISKPSPDWILVSDYYYIIRKARQSRQLTQSQLARFVAEKESVIQHIESASARPSDVVAKKLEKFLKITLFEEPPESSYMKLKSSSAGFTLGDLLKKK